jgi:hypothetical protein
MSRQDRCSLFQSAPSFEIDAIDIAADIAIMGQASIEAENASDVD